MLPETKQRSHQDLYSHPAGFWRHASLQTHRLTPPRELLLACSLHQWRPKRRGSKQMGGRRITNTNRSWWTSCLGNNKLMYTDTTGGKKWYRTKNVTLQKEPEKGQWVWAYLGFAGLSWPSPRPVQRHSPMFPGPFEQILHHFIGALLLGRPNDLLPAALWSPRKKPGGVSKSW